MFPDWRKPPLNEYQSVTNPFYLRKNIPQNFTLNLSLIGHFPITITYFNIYIRCFPMNPPPYNTSCNINDIHIKINKTIPFVINGPEPPEGINFPDMFTLTWLGNEDIRIGYDLNIEINNNWNEYATDGRVAYGICNIPTANMTVT